MSTLKSDVLKDVAETVSVNVVDLPGAITGAVTLRSDLADDTNPALGAGLSGFNPLLSYPADTVGSTLQDLTADVLLASDFVNVKSFGAVGDGIADDTAAIQAALDSVMVSKLTLHIPAGVYKITSTLLYDTTGDLFTQGLRMVGDGFYSSILKNQIVAGGATLAMSSGASSNDFMMGGVISDIGFTESGSGPNSHGITYRGCWHQKFSSLRFQALNGSGLKCLNLNSDGDSSAHVAIDTIRAFDCQGAGYDTDGGLGGISNHTLENSFFANNGRALTGMANVILDGAVHFHMRLNSITGQGGTAPNVPGVWIKNTNLACRVITIEGGEVGNNLGDHIVVDAVQTLHVKSLRHVRRTGETNSTRGYVFPDGALACRNVCIDGIELQIDTAAPAWTFATIGSSVGPNFRIGKINNTAFAGGNVYYAITAATFGGKLEDVDGIEIQASRLKRLRTSYGTPGNITIDLRAANWHQINFTAAGAYALQAPTTNLTDGYEMVLTVINTVAATLTFPAAIAAQGYTDSATTKSAAFAYDLTSATWRQIGAWSTAT